MGDDEYERQECKQESREAELAVSVPVDPVEKLSHTNPHPRAKRATPLTR
jgi:hypothetical protein